MELLDGLFDFSLGDDGQIFDDPQILKDATAMLLTVWLEDLKNGGVDLEKYGKGGMDVHYEGLVNWGFFWSHYFLAHIDYGPSPSDWSVTIGNWDDPELRGLRPRTQLPLAKEVPGDWVEDEDENEEDGLGDEESAEHDVDEADDEREEKEIDDSDEEYNPFDPNWTITIKAGGALEQHLSELYKKLPKNHPA